MAEAKRWLPDNPNEGASILSHCDDPLRSAGTVLDNQIQRHLSRHPGRAQMFVLQKQRLLPAHHLQGYSVPGSDPYLSRFLILCYPDRCTSNTAKHCRRWQLVCQPWLCLPSTWSLSLIAQPIPWGCCQPWAVNLVLLAGGSESADFDQTVGLCWHLRAITAPAWHSTAAAEAFWLEKAWWETHIVTLNSHPVSVTTAQC